MKKNPLIHSAIELVRLGEMLEASRNKLKQLVEEGIAYDSDDMKAALNECMLLDAQWKSLEKQHLDLRQSLYDS